MKRIFPKELPSEDLAQMARLMEHDDPAVRLRGEVSRDICLAIMQGAAKLEDAESADDESVVWSEVVDKLLVSTAAAIGLVVFRDANPKTALQLAEELGDAISEALTHYVTILQAGSKKVN